MKRQSGVYAIRCAPHSRVYVGSSINISDRWVQHRYHLNRGTHHSPYLQHAWNKYGADTFTFEVLEEAPPDRLLEREQHWMDACRSYHRDCGYNISEAAGRVLLPRDEIVIVEDTRRVDRAMSLLESSLISPQSRDAVWQTLKVFHDGAQDDILASLRSSQDAATAWGVSHSRARARIAQLHERYGIGRQFGGSWLIRQEDIDHHPPDTKYRKGK